MPINALSVSAIAVGLLTGWISSLTLRGWTMATLAQAFVVSLAFFATFGVGLFTASLLGHHGSLDSRVVLLSAVAGLSVHHTLERWRDWRRRRAR
jgi:hypothetical protein